MKANGPMNADTATTATALRIRPVRRPRAAFRWAAMAKPSSRVGFFDSGWMAKLFMPTGSARPFGSRSGFPGNWLSPGSQQIHSANRQSSYGDGRRFAHEHVHLSPATSASPSARTPARRPATRPRAARAAGPDRGPEPLVTQPQRVGQRLLRRGGALDELELAQLLLRLVRRQRDHDRRQAAAGVVGTGASDADLRVPFVERARAAGAHGDRLGGARLRPHAQGVRPRRRLRRGAGAGADAD